MRSVSVNPAAIEDSAERLEECAGRLGVAADRLFESTRGAPWGHHDAGTGFGNEYARLSLHARFAFASRQDLLRDASKRLSRWAEGSRTTDLRAGDQLRVFRQVLEAD